MVGAVKAYPGGFTLLRIHDSGYALNSYKIRSALARMERAQSAGAGRPVAATVVRTGGLGSQQHGRPRPVRHHGGAGSGRSSVGVVVRRRTWSAGALRLGHEAIVWLGVAGPRRPARTRPVRHHGGRP